ncbi:MAG: hypothetical protein RJA07_1562 [Bacteroidota bacterium]|jgi:outer membrane protein OmpA-like peptidoglycan-associated protein/tetratricopeptide (TPR) repeat protein
MNKIITAILSAIILISVAQFAQAQSYSLRKANKLYNQYNYSQAIVYYKKAVQTDSNNLFIKQRLAASYNKVADAENACYWYKQFINMPSALPNERLSYAEALQEMGNIDEAAKWYQNYFALNPTDKRGMAGIKACNQIKEWYADSAKYAVKPVLFNTSYSDMCPAYFENGIVFSSDRPSGAFSEFEHGWAGRPFYNLYFENSNRANTYVTPTLWKGKANTKFHDATISFNQIQTEVFYTRNNYNGWLPNFSKDGAMKLKIYHQRKTDGEWSKPDEFIHNSSEYNCCHPALSADGMYLYFASDMPGGLGGMDIYVCKNELGQWGAPKNLGADINTEGNEVFPYLSLNNTLYFSSDALVGLGGLDIFATTQSKDGKWAEPENVGFPVNSMKDDFGIITNEKGDEGYFTSSRTGNDDIYTFTKKCNTLMGIVFDAETNEPLNMANVKWMEKGKLKRSFKTNTDGIFKICVNNSNDIQLMADKETYSINQIDVSKDMLNGNQLIKIPLTKKQLVTMPYFDSTKVKITLSGTVFNEGTKQPMEGVSITLENFKTNETKSLTTTAMGDYHFDLAYNTKYRISATKNKCGSNWNEVSTEGMKTSQDIKQGIGMYCTGDVVKIDDIYYDVDKSNIRPDAALELDKTVAILQKYPTMQIELRSHTDCRANNDYNLTLSQRRAESAVAYLVSKGIKANRLVAKGYGETLLTNKCADGVPCTDAEHQANRRTEFKIKGI